MSLNVEVFGKCALFLFTSQFSVITQCNATANCITTCALDPRSGPSNPSLNPRDCSKDTDYIACKCNLVQSTSGGWHAAATAKGRILNRITLSARANLKDKHCLTFCRGAAGNFIFETRSKCLEVCCLFHKNLAVCVIVQCLNRNTRRLQVSMQMWYQNLVLQLMLACFRNQLIAGESQSDM